jgi:hypothetical protein
MAYTNIDDPSAYFQTATYTGAGANQTVTNDGNSDLQPDFLWIKRRNAGYAHALFDSNRGLGSSNPPMLESNSTAVENSNQNWISGVGTDSFTIGINEQNLSNTSGTYVAWQWKANGGTTSSNTDGSITSTVQANTDAGFSIVTYTGAASAGTIGHGLGVAPKVVLVRARSRISSWVMFHEDGSTSDDDYFVLQSTAAKGTQAGLWNNQYPSSTVFGVSTDLWLNANGSTYVAYCFAEKQGYSKFGKYVGNGNGSNGPFIYTGFKPAWVMIKNLDATQVWILFDSGRTPFNRDDAVNSIYPNATSAEYTGASYHGVDMMSNGFKVKLTDAAVNTSGTDYLYMAFAESPFVTSTGIPTTAR